MVGWKGLFSKKQEAPDEAWSHYFATIDDRPGSIVFNEDISKRVNDLPHSHGLIVKLRLLEWNDDGLTTNEEADRLNSLEDELCDCLSPGGGIMLGRVTSNRVRWIMFLIHKRQLRKASKLQELAKGAGYEGIILTREDPDKAVYWEELYPDADSRQSLEDLRVISVLREHGDDQSATRRIDHWAFFKDEAGVSEFTQWATGEGFSDFETDPEPSGDKYGFSVRFCHYGETWLAPLSHHTIKLNRKCTELGGEYDGWETYPVQDEA